MCNCWLLTLYYSSIKTIRIQTQNMRLIVTVFVVLHITMKTSSNEVCSNQPADLAFLIDESGSVGEDNFVITKDFVTQIVNFFEISQTQLKISVFAFHHAVDTTDGFYFNRFSTKQSVLSAIKSMKYSSGGTDFEIPLRFAKNNIFQKSNGMRDFALKMLVFITDGQASLGPQPGSDLRQMGVIVYAVGVGSGTVTDILKLIATNTSYIFPVANYDLISEVEGTLRTKACEDIMSNPCERNPKPCKNGAVCSVRGGADYNCLCMEGYTGHNCDIDIDDCEEIICYNGGTCIDGLNRYTCNCLEKFTGRHCEIDMCKPYPADVVFLMDSSRSSTGTLFNIQKDVIQSVTKDWNFHPNNFQIAIVSFGKTAVVEASFENIRSANDLNSKLASISQRGGSSNLHFGLEMAIDILKIERDHISNTRKMLVLLSDGLPSEPRLMHLYPGKLSLITTFAVAIGEDVSHYFLRELTSNADRVFSYNNNDLRNAILSELIDDSCEVCKRSEEADIVIAVDQVEIGENALLSVVPTILNKGLDSINFGLDNSRLAMIAFDEVASIRFTFKNYSQHNINKLRKDIAFFEHSTSSFSNLTLALQVARDVLYNSVYGARDSARKIVLILSGFQTDLHEDSETILHEFKEKGVGIYTIGTYIDSTSFRVMSEIASSSFHIGINGTIFADQIDTFIDIFSRQLDTVTCKPLI